jgi:hypothetical protein
MIGRRARRFPIDLGERGAGKTVLGRKTDEWNPGNEQINARAILPER